MSSSSWRGTGRLVWETKMKGRSSQLEAGKWIDESVDSVLDVIEKLRRRGSLRVLGPYQRKTGLSTLSYLSSLWKSLRSLRSGGRHLSPPPGLRARCADSTSVFYHPESICPEFPRIPHSSPCGSTSSSRVLSHKARPNSESSSSFYLHRYD